MLETVSIEREIQLTHSQHEHIMCIIRSKQLFVSMKAFKNSIVAKHFYLNDGTDEIEVLCIRNVMDPNDETLQCVLFTHSVVDDVVVCHFHDADLCDSDDFIDKFVFETITLNITENRIIFEMKYNKCDHPQYISKMFGQFFDKMLDEYITEFKLQE